MMRGDFTAVAMVIGMLAAGSPATGQIAVPAQTPPPVPGPTPAGELDVRVQKLVASISEERLEQLLTKLVSFRTRNTLSDPELPNGLGEARQWILDEMKQSSPRLQVSFDTHTIPAGARIPRNRCARPPRQGSRRRKIPPAPSSPVIS